MNRDIPEFSLQRMPIYLNFLRTLPDDGTYNYISSGAIAQALGLGEVLVRKDLAYTGCAGRPKVGYPRVELIAALEKFLCVNDSKCAVIVAQLCFRQRPQKDRHIYRRQARPSDGRA